MLRVALLLLLCVFLARTFWRIVDGLIEGITGRPRAGAGVPKRGVQMVRDPVCGTFVLPERALSLTDGPSKLFFCSAACRDKYRSQPSPGAGRPEPLTRAGSPGATSKGERAEGRTA